MTAASQRLQIALYSLEAQEGSVAHAAQRVDELRSQAPNDVLRKELQTRLQEVKANSAHAALESQKLQGLEAEASSDLRTEQAKLSEIQTRLEKLDQAHTR